jgi:uncharacterized membrane protein YdbT with pleckstrin-like domain
MSEKTKESLSVFMKKQISEKSSKKTLAKKLNAAATKNLQSDSKKDKENTDSEDEMTDEEKLEEAKKLSRGKASQQDQSEMLKKLFLETAAKYTLLFVGLALLSIAVIKYGPVLIGLLNGLVFKSIISTISR